MSVVRLLSLVSVLLLVGCAPPPDFAERADDARRACDLTDLVPLDRAALDGPTELTPRCVARLAVDLKVDLPAFATIDDRDPSDLDPETRGGTLLRAAWMLLAVDLGDADALGLDLPTAEPTAGGAAYDYVAGLVTHTTAGERRDVWARLAIGPRTLQVHRPIPGVFGAGVLLHEARHGEVGVAHEPCAFDPSLTCDSQPDGPYAWQAALYRTASEAAIAPDLADELADLADLYETRSPARP